MKIKASRLTLKLFVMLGIALVAWLPLNSWAHAGHDEGESPPVQAVSGSSQAKLNLSSDDTELVAVVRNAKLWLYVDDYRTNAPLTHAKVTVESNGQALIAKAAGTPGTYVLETPWLEKPGDYELVISIEAEKLDDLLVGTLHVAGEKHAAASIFWTKIPAWAYLMIVVIFMVVLFFLYKYKRYIIEPGKKKLSKLKKVVLPTDRAAML